MVALKMFSLLSFIIIVALLVEPAKGFVGTGVSFQPLSSFPSCLVKDYDCRKSSVKSPIIPTKHGRCSSFGSRCNVRLAMSDVPLGDSDDIALGINQSFDMNAALNVCIIIFAIAAISQNLFSAVPMVDMRGWTGEEQMIRLAQANWERYSNILQHSPIQTKALTSATVYTIGDFISQKAEGVSMGEIDRPRILRSLLAGLIGHGPMSHYWYNFCDNLFENILHMTEWWSFFPKVMVDQSTWGPIWNNTYILLLGLMKMDKLENIWGEMKRTTIPLIVSGLKLWPLAHCVTYGLVPVENRLLWVDLIEIIWVFILATAVSGGGHGHGSAIEEQDDTTTAEC